MTRLVSSAVCLAGSGFFSTLYAALTVTGNAGVSRLEDTFPKAVRRMERWASRWNLLRAALLIAAVALQVVTVALLVLHFSARGSAFSLGEVGVLAGLVLLFALVWEVLPTVLSESYADRLTVLFFPAAVACAGALYAVAWPFARLERRLLALCREKAPEKDRPSSEDEIISVVESAAGADLKEEEREMIRSVFEFRDTVVREIMTPRVRMEAVDGQETVEACLRRVGPHHYSRYPVFHESVDRIVGVVHVKDLLEAVMEGRREAPVSAFVQQTVFVPESTPISLLMRQMRAARLQMAVAVDEYGGTAGLVTMEDILEELIGEIRDEFDADEVDVPETKGREAVFSGDTPVDEINEAMRLTLPENDVYESIAGFISHALGRIPAAGEVVEAHGVRMHIEEADERRIRRVRIVRADPSL